MGELQRLICSDGGEEKINQGLYVLCIHKPRPWFYFSEKNKFLSIYVNPEAALCLLSPCKWYFIIR